MSNESRKNDERIMMPDPARNIWLTFRSGVLRTDVTDAVIAMLELHFAKARHHALVTSVFRDSTAQLRLIQDECRIRRVADEFQEVLTATVDGRLEIDGEKYHGWQRAWSRLLSRADRNGRPKRSYIIAPPLDAVCLFPYTNKRGEERQGQIIFASRHRLGTEFDIGGRGGNDPTVEDERRVVQAAIESDPEVAARITGTTLERDNNCLHVSCRTQM